MEQRREPTNKNRIVRPTLAGNLLGAAETLRRAARVRGANLPLLPPEAATALGVAASPAMVIASPEAFFTSLGLPSTRDPPRELSSLLPDPRTMGLQFILRAFRTQRAAALGV